MWISISIILAATHNVNACIKAYNSIIRYKRVCNFEENEFMDDSDRDRVQYVLLAGASKDEVTKSLDKIYVYSTFIGAIINLVFNLIFISRYGAIGACIGTVLAEYSIPIYQTFHVRKALDVRVFINILLIFILKASVVMLVIYTVGLFVNNIYLKLVLQIIIAVFLFIVQNKKFIFIEFLGRN